MTDQSDTAKRVADLILTGWEWHKDGDWFYVGPQRCTVEEMGQAWRLVALGEQERADRIERGLRGRLRERIARALYDADPMIDPKRINDAGDHYEYTWEEAGEHGQEDCYEQADVAVAVVLAELMGEK